MNARADRAIAEVIERSPTVASSAAISPCGKYRYSLHRTWDQMFAKRRVLFLMLNPSFAGPLVDDPTVNRVVGFGKRWGFGGADVANLYAWRSTDPAELLVEGRDIVGPENDAAIDAMAAVADRIVCAWGAHRAAQLPFTRAKTVLNRLARHENKLFALKLTKDGAPSHPLYVPYEVDLVPFGRTSHRVEGVR